MGRLAAAIYARISHDSAGTALGVKRQEQDCRAFCNHRGWPVADVLLDNDVSAYGKKRRPAYSALLDGIESGRYDALVVWHPDRLHRSPVELEQFIDVVERTGLLVATVTAGDYDLSTPEGRLTARIVGSVARKESEDKSRRLRRKHLELAEGGKVSGGGRRPFGYETDRVTLRADEAAEIAAAAQRVLAGESVRSVSRDWAERGVRTVTGAVWSPTTVKRLLMSGRISGQREHHGCIVGRAEWPAIIEPADTLKLRAILSDPARASGTGSTARSYLLTGWVACGQCGATMTTRPVIRKGHRYRRYVCVVDRAGCGRCGIGAQPLEDLISEAVLIRLDTPALAKAVTRRRRSEPTVEGVEQVNALQARLAELAEMFAGGEISRYEWATARQSLDRRLSAVRDAVATGTRQNAAAVYVGHGDVLRSEWSTMNLERRRAVIGAVIDRIDIAPTTKANNKFDPARVDVTWTA